MKLIEGGVCAAKGFLAGGVHCGIRKNRTKKDLSLIYSEQKATAAAVFLAKTRHTKEQIRDYIRENFYPLDKTLAQIRPDYRFDATCPGSVPQALLCFLESTDYEDTLRNAVSLGGDADTLAAIAGSIAWTYYGQKGMGASMADIYRQAYPMLPAEFHRTARELAQLRRCPDDQLTTTEA